MGVFSSIQLARAQAATLSGTLFFTAHDQGTTDMWWGLRSLWSAVQYCMLVLIVIIVQVS